MQKWIKTILVFLLISLNPFSKSSGQGNGCILKDTLFTIDFGSATKLQEFNFNSLYYYQRDFGTCPLDGYFSYAAYTANCFNRDWITMNEDHTPNDSEGRMMLVNASGTPSLFFNLELSGFKDTTIYKFQAWMLNLCRPNGGCSPLPARIRITFEDMNGKIVSDFNTGLLPQMEDPHWRKYIGYFTTPVNANSLYLKMYDLTEGNCGNDFAVDDITIQQCYKPEPLIVAAPKKEARVPVISKLPKKEIPQNNTVQKEITKLTTKPVTSNTTISEPEIKPIFLNVVIPEPIRTRENPVVKNIETTEEKILIQLYDNGEIDGDTVSIYHNNQLVISNAALSEKPITFYVDVDNIHNHHELVMVAENLGSIPPNTSLMIVTTKDKRYEIFISSTEQKNA
ncbi:MAG: hypothetical protein ABJA90_11380, partial [Ginsengibacter sp.]